LWRACQPLAVASVMCSEHCVRIMFLQRQVGRCAASTGRLLRSLVRPTASVGRASAHQCCAKARCAEAHPTLTSARKRATLRFTSALARPDRSNAADSSRATTRAGRPARTRS
jgi:hypothetical protein